MPHIATDVTARGPSVCASATLLHLAKAVGRNEMSFGHTRVVPSNIDCVREESRSPHGKGDFGIETDGPAKRRRTGR